MRQPKPGDVVTLAEVLEDGVTGRVLLLIHVKSVETLEDGGYKAEFDSKEWDAARAEIEEAQGEGRELVLLVPDDPQGRINGRIPEVGDEFNTQEYTVH